MQAMPFGVHLNRAYVGFGEQRGRQIIGLHCAILVQSPRRGLIRIKNPRGAHGVMGVHPRRTSNKTMEIPLQVSFHGIDHSDALSSAIRTKAKKLERYYAHIVSCRVVLELAAGHKRKGKQYSARIDLKVPGGEIAVTHMHDEDLHIALHDAFDAARRRLEDYARVQRGD
jgi:ribosomal subunit interface protein